MKIAGINCEYTKLFEFFVNIILYTVSFNLV